jgi:DNA-binding transcriptional ArsR family regulator
MGNPDKKTDIHNANTPDLAKAPPTAQKVFATLRGMNIPPTGVRLPVIWDAVKDMGITTGPEALRLHLSKLVKAGLVEKTKGGRLSGRGPAPVFYKIPRGPAPVFYKIEIPQVPIATPEKSAPKVPSEPVDGLRVRAQTALKIRQFCAELRKEGVKSLSMSEDGEVSYEIVTIHRRSLKL